MAQLDKEKIRKLERGELLGTVASIFCGVAFVYFVVMFAISWASDNATLEIITWSTAPALIVIGIAVAAFASFKYGRAMEREIEKYAVEVLVENAALLHPERDSLSFYFDTAGRHVEITVNGYKDRIVFDFSAFKRFGLTRRMNALRIISDRLTATFCRLYERGATYKSVEYHRRNLDKKTTSKTVPVIVNGVPDKKIMKNYLKNR